MPTSTARRTFRNLTLLREPQAAFYAWIERHPNWRERVKVGDLILVVDIGAGTTDFTACTHASCFAEVIEGWAVDSIRLA